MFLNQATMNLRVKILKIKKVVNVTFWNVQSILLAKFQVQYMHKWIEYKKRLLPRCMHNFKLDIIKNMEHMSISGTETSSVILSQTKYFKRFKGLFTRSSLTDVQSISAKHTSRLNTMFCRSANVDIFEIVLRICALYYYEIKQS